MMIAALKTRSILDRCNIVNDEDLKQATLKQSAYLKEQTTAKTTTIVNFKEKGVNPAHWRD